MKKSLILQVSIPFCVKRCSYCAYPHCSYEPGTVRAYAKALMEEIDSYRDEMQDYEVQAISVEGGSPALLGADALQEILRKIKKVFCCAEDLQISLQTMPGDYSRALMEKMRDAGVNFITIGIQTAQQNEHDVLERPYKFDAITMIDTAIRTFEPRPFGFELLCGIPGQTVHSLEQTLKRCLVYVPEHMSILPLMFPADSALKQKILAGEISPVPDIQVHELRTFADHYLKEFGYEPYTAYDYVKKHDVKINYGISEEDPYKIRDPYRNRFRLLYLTGCEYLGLGYHSSSWLDGIMWSTGHSLQEYLTQASDFAVTAVNPVRPDEESINRICKEHEKILNGRQQY